MTESEWLECTHPRPMLEFLGDEASDRKYRLFALACCRKFGHFITDERTRQAFRVAEWMADGKADAAEQEAAYDAAFEAAEDAFRARLAAKPEVEELVRAAKMAGMGEWVLADGWGAAEDAASLDWDNRPEIPRQGPALLRDVFGNPFRPASLDPRWLTPAVLRLARAIYDEQTFGRMPELADALEKAGCTNQDVLGHCRGPGPHVRGCWVVDLILGKS